MQRVVPESITARIGGSVSGSYIILSPYINPYPSTPQKFVGFSSLLARGIENKPYAPFTT
jgi:hypothetical protein